MLFKNAFIYTFPRLPNITESLIEAAAAKPCGEQEMARAGFVKPSWSHDYILCEGDYWLLCLSTEEKILPPAVINEHTSEKVRHIEFTEDRKVFAKERSAIKDEVTFDLMPKAFTKHRRTHAIIDTENHLLIIDQSSPARAEEFCTMLRDAIGSLEVAPIRCSNSPAMIMTAWLDNRDAIHQPGTFRFGSCAKLKHPNSGPSYAIQDDDLEGEHVQSLIESGLGVVELELSNNHRANFTLTDGFVMKSLNYSDVLISEAYEMTGDDDDLYALARSDLLINGNTISETVNALARAFGGALTEEFDFDGEQDGTALDHVSAVVKAEQTLLQEMNDEALHDQLYEEGVKFVRENDSASISGLQRNLRIGYNRVARMIEQMEADGVVSAMSDSGTRVVYQDDSAD